MTMGGTTDMFSRMDVNGDGVVSRSEFNTAMRR